MNLKHEERERSLKVLIECLEGQKHRHMYFCRKSRPERGALPEDGLLTYIAHDARQYIPLIDDVAWGLAFYSRELAPWEIARYGLIAAPKRED